MTMFASRVKWNAMMDDDGMDEIDCSRFSVDLCVCYVSVCGCRKDDCHWHNAFAEIQEKSMND